MAKKKSTRSQSNKSRKPVATRPVHMHTGDPVGRGILAAVCFILAAFTFIGYWNSEGIFIGFFIGLIKGLFGYGYYAFPPALLFCSIILIFHRGRPVRLRTTCVILSTILIGAFFHLFTKGHDSNINNIVFNRLWQDGINLSGGGIISGTLTELLKWLFNYWGAMIVLICISILLFLIAINRTIVDIVDAYRNRPRPEYDYEYDDDYYAAKTNSASTSASAGVTAKPQKQGFFSNKPKKGHIDIPIDGEVLSEQDKRKEKDEYIIGSKYPKSDKSEKVEKPEIIPEVIKAEGEKEPVKVIEDMPLDIPFMEGRNRKSAISRRIDLAGELYERDPEAQNEKLTNIQSEADRLSELDKKLKQKAKPEPKQESKLPGTLDVNSLSGYAFPPLSLLSHGTPVSKAGDDEVRLTSERLKAAFESFGINVVISKATRGPAVTRYEAELEAGVKLSRITGLADDIALSLGTLGVRIAAMPNKIATVGIEVPNRSISTVSLRDIIESKEFEGAKSKLTFAIGMDISGAAIVGDIAKLPHLLIAGTTGSGKSVCLNSLILSILYKSSPEDVRFIMIDPKMVEFKVYNSIPHLLVPVVTDVKKAAGALQWAVFEMMKRYGLFADANARDLAGYNQVARRSGSQFEIIPQVIIVIDELADLMLIAGKEVEESVCRVAQMGRAAGMHLVIATQSPRADVITGLMKANIPSRISFKVASALESRIILDAGGNADKLVGRGDMLYAPIGGAKPTRVQGTWVTDRERELVVDFIKREAESNYSDEVIHEIEMAAQNKSSSGGKSSGGAGDTESGNDFDDLLPQAVDVIFETGQASVSMLQRRLKLGYARAARIVDQMEQMGIVGPFEGSKPRALLITKDQWHQMQYSPGVAPED